MSSITMISDPGLAGEIGERFDHVLVDEYQDTNRLQASILFALKPGGRGLTVVGDDAQSIYSFRAATVRNILDFPGQFSPPAVIITLDRNYRSTQPILAAANGVIDLACERFTKNLWTDRIAAERPQLVSVGDETGQVEYIVARVLENREGGTTLKQQAVLFRASHYSGPLEVELTRRNIPFVKFGGLKFLDAAHVKDMLALLRFVENPRDRVAGFRVMQLMPGVGPTSAQRVLNFMMDAADPIGALACAPSPPRAGASWAAFIKTIIELRAGRAGWPAELERARLWYEPHLDRIHEDFVMPSPVFALEGKKSDPGVTNVRNVKSPHWRRWLGIENRCVVPWTSFSENDVLPDGSRPPVWFAFDDTRPLAFFAGVWTRWTSVRKVKEGETTSDIFAFLTTEPTKEVGALHPKAMPVVLTTREEIDAWMNAPAEAALKLQRPVADNSLKIVARGDKKDGGGLAA